MDAFKETIQAMNEETYLALRKGVEIGKWPNGMALTQAQRETSMRAVLAYEAFHQVSADQQTGFVDTASSDCHDSEGNHIANPDQETILKWQK